MALDPILDTAPCGFASVGDDGDLLELNQTLAEMLGSTVGALRGLHVDKLFTAPSRIFYQTHVFPTLKLQGRVHEVYVALRDAHGGEVPALLNAVRRPRDERFVSDWVIVAMRQRNEYENEILKARRAAEAATHAKDEFLAMVSHELRSPLSAISGWAQLLGGGTLDAAGTARAIQSIARNARQQGKLIDDVLDFTRISEGKMRLEVSPLELNPLIADVVEGVQPAATAKGIRIDSVLDSSGAIVSGDPDRLRQVLWNMLANAVKFTPQGGRVQVRLVRVNSSVEVSVADNGKGIDAPFLPHVFERFRQEEASGRQEGGLGLGMAISRHLVELHGGSIRAESPGAGLGATFTVRLPVAAARMRNAEPVLAAIAEPPVLAGLDILVVDNDPDTLDMLVAVISQAQGRARTAMSAAEAIARYQERRPDLLLSDIEMEGGDGYALVRRIREIERGSASRTPAIALTARAHASDRLRALSAGFQLHIPKPVDPVELVVAIANLAEPN